MKPAKLCISTASVPGNLPAKLSAIAEVGFHGIELFEQDFICSDSSAGDIAKITEDLGLSIFLYQGFRDFEGLPEALSMQAFDRLEHSFDVMQSLGTDLLLVASSTHPEACSDLERMTADLSKLAERLEKRDMHAAYMALPWARHIKNHEAAIDLVRSVDKPNLGVALNSGFSLSDGSQPARLRDVPGDKLFHVQLSDGLTYDAAFQRDIGHTHLLPGQGTLNLAGFVRVLGQSGYRGCWSSACVSDSVPSGNKDIVTDSFRALINVLDEVARSEPDLEFDIPDLPERVYTSGFEFIEFTADDESGQELAKLLSRLCFRKERQHISKSVELWRQGSVNIVVNTDNEGFARRTFEEHGPSVCDMGLRVKDAGQTVARASALGTPIFSQPVGTGELDIPALRGVGGNVVHFIDEKSDLHRVWDIEFEPVAKAQVVPPAGLRRIDHVAQTMKYDEMQSWLLYYISTFEMEKTSVLDVTDPAGVIRSQAIASPEGEVRLNLNGADSSRTFAGAFLGDRFEAGVQHIALLTDDIFETSEHLEHAGLDRLTIPDNYYADLLATFGLDEDFTRRLQAGNILYDRTGGSEYFQIYSVPIFKGFFFEIVERRGGYAGYGARNAPIRIAAQMKHLQP